MFSIFIISFSLGLVCNISFIYKQFSQIQIYHYHQVKHYNSHEVQLYQSLQVQFEFEKARTYPTPYITRCQTDTKLERFRKKLVVSMSGHKVVLLLSQSDYRVVLFIINHMYFPFTPSIVLNLGNFFHWQSTDLARYRWILVFLPVSEIKIYRFRNKNLLVYKLKSTHRLMHITFLSFIYVGNTKICLLFILFITIVYFL